MPNMINSAKNALHRSTSIKRLILEFNNEQYQKVIKTIKRLPRSLREQPMTQQLLGLSHYKQGRYEIAERVLERVAARSANTAELLTNLGLCKQDSGKTKHAINCYEKSLKLDPYHVDTYINYASLLIEIFDFQKGINILNEGIKIFPSDVNLRINICIAHIKNGSFEKALLHANEARKKNPNHLQIKEINADCYRMAGKKELAKNLYEEIINNSKEENPQLLYKLELCKPKKEIDTRIFNLVVNQKFDFATWNNALSSIAEAHEKLVKELLPKMPSYEGEKNLVILSAVNNLIRLHQYDLANKVVDDVLEKDAENSRAVVYKSQILYALNYTNEAVAWAFKAASLMNDNSDILNNLGLYLWASNNHQAAFINFNKSLEIDPKNVKTLINMSYCAKEAGHPSQAIDFAKRALQNSPSSPEARLNLAMAYFASGQNLAKAYELFESRFSIKNSSTQYLNFSNPRLNQLSDAKNKKIIIWEEQGVADVLHYLCFHEKIILAAKSVVIIVDKRLIALIRMSLQFKNVIVTSIDQFHANYSECDFDYNLPVGDLAKLENFDGSYSPKSYLKSPDVTSFPALKALKLENYNKVIGISWTGAAATDKKRNKYFTELKDWYELIIETDAVFVNINYTDVTKEFLQAPDAVKEKFILPDFNLKDDFQQLTCLLKQCHLVVGPLNTPVMMATLSGIQAVGYYKYEAEKNLGRSQKKGAWRQAFLPNNIVFDLSVEGDYDFRRQVKDYVKLFANNQNMKNTI